MHTGGRGSAWGGQSPVLKAKGVLCKGQRQDEPGEETQVAKAKGNRGGTAG